MIVENNSVIYKCKSSDSAKKCYFNFEHWFLTTHSNVLIHMHIEPLTIKIFMRRAYTLDTYLVVANGQKNDIKQKSPCIYTNK